MAFIRNHYVGRSFLQPTQLIRDFNVRVKLNLIASLVKDKRVVIVDDSIVRGTTCKTRVKTLKEAGAKEVHVAVSCPPHMNPCVYGIDFPDRSKLMAANNTVDEIRKYLNADSLHYLSQAGMVEATGLPKEAFCMACYDGNYPVPYDPLLDKHIIERRKLEGGVLHGVLRWALSRALRPGTGQTHHRTPQTPGPDARRSRGERLRTNQAAARLAVPEKLTHARPIQPGLRLIQFLQQIISPNARLNGSLREFYASFEIHFGRVGLQPSAAWRIRAQSGANSFGFTGHETYPIDNGIALLHSADLTGDGLNDLIVVNNCAGKLTCFTIRPARPTAPPRRRASLMSMSFRPTRDSGWIPFPLTSHRRAVGRRLERRRQAGFRFLRRHEGP